MTILQLGIKHKLNKVGFKPNGGDHLLKSQKKSPPLSCSLVGYVFEMGNVYTNATRKHTDSRNSMKINACKYIQ